jgi:hypothetical protein
MAHNTCGTIMEPPTGCDFSLQEQHMSARKLSRVAGLVFVLAAILGGVGAAGAIAEHETGGSPVSNALVVRIQQASDTVWN